MTTTTKKPRRKDPPIPHARNKELLAQLMEMKRQGLLTVDEHGVWRNTAAGEARFREAKKSKLR